MGLFSDKKKTVVNTTVQQMFEDTAIPDSARAGILRGIMAEGDIKDYMLEELTGSIGVRAARGYGWAKRNDYIFGIPTGQVTSVVKAKGIVLSTIASLVGQTIRADYCKYGPLNTLHFGWTWIIANMGYNPNTNELTKLTAQVGKKVYLSNMVATYNKEDYDFIIKGNDLDMLAQWGPSPGSGYTPTHPYTNIGTIGQYAAQPPYVVDDTIDGFFVTITYEFKDATGVIVKRSENVDLADLDGSDYHQVRYIRADGVVGYWTYKEGQGQYPDIDGAYAMPFNELGTYLPWCYFRKEGTRVLYDPNETFYNHASKWCTYLGVDYLAIDMGIHEDPNVNDVEQALLIFGVNPAAQSQAELNYLFEYFNIMYFNSLSQMELANNLQEKFGAFSSSPSQAQYIRDRYFSMTFQYSGITKNRLAGKIGKLGKFTGHYADLGQPAYVYRKQVLDSMYEEVVVYNLKVTYDVSSKKGFSAGPGEKELLVPVDRVLLNSLSMRNKEQLLCRSLYMVVNTLVEIRTPWYASSWFKAIMIIAAVVITVLSGGTAWQTLVAAASLGATALAITVITMIVSAIAVQVAVKLFVKAVGPQIGFIAAVAAMAYGAASAMTTPAGEASWASNLVSVGNNLVKESQSVSADNLKEVADDMADFQAYAQGEFDSLKEQREQLGLNPQFSGLNGLDFVGYAPMQVWGESPNDFYSRTVHSGNIGAASLDMTSTFVDHMLKLPEIDVLPQPQEGATNGVPID